MPRVTSGPPSLEQAKRALATAPGPTPWFATNTTLTGARGPLHFREAERDARRATFLCDAAENVLAIFGFYCWTKAVDAGRFLVWYERRLPWGPVLEKRTIVVRQYDADSLRPIEEVAQAWARLTSEPVVTADGSSPRIELLLPNWIENGAGFEDELGALAGEEFFILVDFAGLVDATGSGSAPPTNLRIWHIEPKNRSLTVHPQRWFNEGDYDFGYQWPTSIAREPETGIVVGSGIRLGVFALSEDLTKVFFLT